MLNSIAVSTTALTNTYHSFTVKKISNNVRVLVYKIFPSWILPCERGWKLYHKGRSEVAAGHLCLGNVKEQIVSWYIGQKE